jgi:hypothetical protein
MYFQPSMKVNNNKKNHAIMQRGSHKYGPAVPCTVGFDPAHAGGHLPDNFALLESYRVLILGLRFPIYKVLAQNPLSVSRTRQE